MSCGSLRLILAGCAAALLAAPSAQAATYYWDSNGTGTPGAGATPNGTWGLDSFWSTDSTGANIGTPVLTATTTSADNVFFSAGTDAVNPYAISLNSATQNAKLVTFKNGSATLSNGTLGLGNSGGITVASTAVTGATIGSNLTTSGGQSFNVAASMALALNTGTFTRNAGSTLNVLSTGTVTTTMTGLSTGSLVNGIIGPWASFGSGTSTKYATIDGSNNIVGLAGTAADTAANVTSTAGTFNYDVAAQGTLGASASVNTLRYTGTAVAAPTMTISTAFTTNGIMNAGVTSGLGLTFSGLKVTSGTGEMVINAASGNIFFTSSSGINNNGNLVTFNAASGMSIAGSASGANISGSGGVTKLGAGTLSFRFASSYSGPTTISEGTILAFLTSVLGDGSATNTLIFNGGTLGSDSAVGNANFVSPATRSVTITSNGGTINTYNAAYLMSIAGNITGAGGLTKADTSGANGNLILSGTNSYGGGTTITGGIMQFAKTAAMPATGTVTVAPASGAIATTLAVNAGAASGEWTNGTTATNGSIGGLLAGLGGQAGSTVTYVGNINLGIDTTNATAATMTYSGVVGNVGTTLGITKLGTGTLVLDQSNTYTGKTTILGGGTLSINSIKNVSGGASAVGNPTTTANGTIDIGSTTTAATLRYVGSGDTTNRVINMAGTTFGSTLDASGSGALVFSSALTATGGGIKTLTLTGSSTAANSIAAIPNSTGTTSVNKTGNGTWWLTAASNFSGQLTVKQGTIVAGVGTGPSGNGVFGAAMDQALLPTVGDNAAGASGFAGMLLGADGVVISRSFQVAALGSGATQVAILGGANTSGTSTFIPSSIRIDRGVTLQAATGGTVDFANLWLDSTGSASPAFSYAIGTAGNLGTVRLSQPLATTSGRSTTP
ncbi:MAG: autotransporter-associated beta strand repeat-containing protein [Planctomycetia bacterium]|nr:autotransporter-associated beta strand repeat-containing protein [Planctomycetia bacterium]